MAGREKFEGLKRGLLEENERRYGAEVRGRYGDAATDASNQKMPNTSEAEYAA